MIKRNLDLTRHVLINHIRAVLHKKAEHGRAPGAALQPEQDRSIGGAWLSGGAEKRVEITAPPCGEFSSLRKVQKNSFINCSCTLIDLLSHN